MSVGEICNREVIVIDQNSTIREAAELMRRHHVGTLVVVEDLAAGSNAKPAGILTDRDIVIEIIAEAVDFNTVLIRDVMSFELVTAREKDGIWETMQRMKTHGIRRMPVVSDAGGLTGILAVDDLLEMLVDELTDLTRLIKQEQRHEEKRRS
jgi:CBS domain-containing protein